MGKVDESLVRLRELPRVECLRNNAGTEDTRAIEAFLAIITAGAHLSAALEEKLATRGLSRGRFTVLMLLRSAEGECSTPAELAEKASVTTATMTGLLDGLEKQKLVRRVHREDDRRSVRVELTRRGAGFLDEYLPGHYEAVRRVMRPLAKDDLAMVAKLCARLTPASNEPATPRPKESERRLRRASR